MCCFFASGICPWPVIVQLAILIITKKSQLCLFKEATACMYFIYCDWPSNLLYFLVPRALSMGREKSRDWACLHIPIFGGSVPSGHTSTTPYIHVQHGPTMDKAMLSYLPRVPWCTFPFLVSQWSFPNADLFSTFCLKEILLFA